MSSNETPDKFKGSGKVIGTLGGLAVGEILTAIPAGIATSQGIKKDSMPLIATGVGLSLVGAIGGAIHGYRKTGRGQDQFTDMVGQRDKAVAAQDVAEAKATFATQFGEPVESHQQRQKAEKEAAASEEVTR